MEEDWAEYLQGGPMPRRVGVAVKIDEHPSDRRGVARPNFLPGLHIAFFRDITERKRLEAELLNAQKLESLGRLAGGVAHDFNNLLTGITGYASLLLERANGDVELRRDLGEIKRAADRAAELTKQLLAFGRRQVLNPRPLDLNAVVAEVGALLQRLARRARRRSRSAPAPDLGTVRADPGQIEQVLVNLAVNARDAMPDGGTAHDRDPRTVATTSFVELVRHRYRARAWTRRPRAQIFEPFFTTREQGVGLGLASVYGIVQQSGGEVTVESSAGERADFHRPLPRVAEPRSRRSRRRSPPRAARLGDDPARRGRGRRPRT